MTERDIVGKTLAWYRFTETPGRTYGPKSFTWILRAYGDRPTCEAAADENGQPGVAWLPMADLALRIVEVLVQPAQRRRLSELGVAEIPDGLTKKAATEMIENLELDQPPDDDELREARKAGVAIDGVTTRRALAAAWAPIEEAEERAEEARELERELAPIRRELKRKGMLFDAGADEEALYTLKDEVESFEMARESAREWWLPASAIPKPDDWTPQQFQTATALLERFATDMQNCLPDYVAHILGRERNPSQSVMKEAAADYYGALRSDAIPWGTETDRWFAARVEEIESRNKPSPPTPAPRLRAAAKSPSTPRRTARASAPWWVRLLRGLFD